jgi:ubiquinone/menaquinone biosynthesis C-methylase UbiE
MPQTDAPAISSEMLSAAEYYDRLAPLYDQATSGRWTPNIVLGPYLQSIARKDLAALDVGCGTGQTLGLLLESGSFKSIVGIDISRKMLDACSRKYPNAQLHWGDFEHVASNIPSQSFDVITCIGAFEFVPDAAAFLRQAVRLLRQGGLLFLTYEPRIQYHELQAANFSEVAPGEAAEGVSIPTDGFVSYRQDPHLIDQLFCQTGLKKTVDVEFVAYQKGLTSIIYHLVIGAITQEATWT